MSSTPPPSAEVLVGLPPNRIEALADGIFAVAMTILVLDLHVPTAPGNAPQGAFGPLLLGLAPKITAYVSGFVILGTLWVGHHMQFRYVRRANRPFLWINLVFLLTVTFLPFVISLLGTYGATRGPCVLYGATLMVAVSSLLVQWQYAAGGHRRLVAKDLPEEVIVALRRRIGLGVVVYGVGLVLAFFAPMASIICYAVMPLLYLLPGRIDQHVQVSR